MHKRPQIYHIRIKIPILEGKIQPPQYSEVKQGRGVSKKFSENSIDLILYRKSIGFLLSTESIDPYLALMEFVSRLNNLCNLLQVKYFCSLGEAQILKSNIPKPLVDSVFHKDEETSAIQDHEKSLIYV